MWWKWEPVQNQKRVCQNMRKEVKCRWHFVQTTFLSCWSLSGSLSKVDFQCECSKYSQIFTKIFKKIFTNIHTSNSTLWYFTPPEAERLFQVHWLFQVQWDPVQNQKRVCQNMRKIMEIKKLKGALGTIALIGSYRIWLARDSQADYSEMISVTNLVLYLLNSNLVFVSSSIFLRWNRSLGAFNPKGNNPMSGPMWGWLWWVVHNVLHMEVISTCIYYVFFFLIWIKNWFLSNLSIISYFELISSQRVYIFNLMKAFPSFYLI